MKVTTTRNGNPTTADICLDNASRLVSALECGVMVQLTYSNLKGVLSTRRCWVKEFLRDELGMIVICGDFGHRTVCLERVVRVA